MPNLYLTKNNDNSMKVTAGFQSNELAEDFVARFTRVLDKSRADMDNYGDVTLEITENRVSFSIPEQSDVPPVILQQVHADHRPVRVLEGASFYV